MFSIPFILGHFLYFTHYSYSSQFPLCASCKLCRGVFIIQILIEINPNIYKNRYSLNWNLLDDNLYSGLDFLFFPEMDIILDFSQFTASYVIPYPPLTFQGCVPGHPHLCLRRQRQNSDHRQGNDYNRPELQACTYPARSLTPTLVYQTMWRMALKLPGTRLNTLS